MYFLESPLSGANERPLGTRREWRRRGGGREEEERGRREGREGGPVIRGGYLEERRVRVGTPLSGISIKNENKMRSW